MNSPTPQLVPPNWYPDPTNADQMRYWDGQKWTEQYYRTKALVTNQVAETATEGVTSLSKAAAPTVQRYTSYAAEQLDEANQALDEAINSPERITSNWEAKLAGTSNWEIAQRNKPQVAKAMATDVSIFDTGHKERSSIFGEDDGQQLWGESDKPSALKRAWHKVPRSWRKPVAIIALVAFLIWILPSIINLATTAINVNSKKNTVEKLIDSLPDSTTERSSKPSLGPKDNNDPNDISDPNVVPSADGKGIVASQPKPPPATSLPGPASARAAVAPLARYLSQTARPGYRYRASVRRPFNLYQCRVAAVFPGGTCSAVNLGAYQQAKLIFIENLDVNFTEGKINRPSGANFGLLVAPPQIADGQTSCFAVVWQGFSGQRFQPQVACPN